MDIFCGPPVAGGAPLPSSAGFGVASVAPGRSRLMQLSFVRWCSVVLLATEMVTFVAASFRSSCSAYWSASCTAACCAACSVTRGGACAGALSA